jgi:acetyl-CoA carboxylase carboxyl transferase subunit alpha
LGIGVGDRVAVFQNAFYSVISAEGCAAILWKTAEQRERAAEALKFTSRELKQLEIIDDILPEPLGGAHRNPLEASRTLEKYLTETLRELSRPRIDAVVKRRYERFRQIASFFNDPSGDVDKPRSRKRDGGGQPLARVRRLGTTNPAEVSDLPS